MLQMDIDQFLDLPDWKKIQLKMTQSKFNSYPIQTRQQEDNRREAILAICAHFAMQGYDSFINMISQRTLDGLWPTAMELFITPKLFDIISYINLLKFGHCYFCDHFQGHNKISYRSINKFNLKVTPLYGICLNAKNEGYSKALSRVIPNQRCVAWTPLAMYEQILDYHIKLILFNSHYRYSDYIKDLNTIDIWDYFQNRYKARG
jgi:hypothetical protein